MEYQEFIKRIQETTGEISPLEAKLVSESVLEILSLRLSRILRKHLVAQLPMELHSIIPEEIPAQVFTLEDLYQRVASRLNVNFHEASVTTRDVMNVVVEAVTPGEINEILASLPIEFAELFGRAPADEPVVEVHHLAPPA